MGRELKQKILRKASQCPTCGKGKLLPLSYGFPSSEGIRLYAARKIALGGCCVTGNYPELECPECGGKLFLSEESTLLVS